MSTEAQSGNDRYGLSRQTQIAEYNEQRHGLKAVATITDVISGGIRDRPGLSSLIEVAKQHQATAISLSEVDRLSRDLTDGYVLIDQLVKTGLDIYAFDLRERVNLREPNSVREINDRLRQAYEERVRMKERTYGGLLAKAKGTPYRDAEPPRKIRAYGYKEGQIFEPEAVHVRWMFEQALTKGFQTIAIELNEREIPSPGRGAFWSKATVRTILTKPLYKGIHEYGRRAVCTNQQCREVRHGNAHDIIRGTMSCERCGSPMTIERYQIPVPAIVSAELFDAVQAKRKTRRNTPARVGSKRHIFHLQGHLYCAECGGTMSSQIMWSNKKLKYYFCNNAINKRETTGAVKKCSHNKLYRIEPLHDAVRTEMQRIFCDEELLKSVMASEAQVDEVAARQIAQERERLIEQIRMADEAYFAKILPLAAYAQKRQEIERAIAALPVPEPTVKLNRDLSSFRREVLQALEHQPLYEVADLTLLTVRLAKGGKFELLLD